MRLLLFVALLQCTVLQVSAEELLYDDFNGTTLDNTKWDVGTPYLGLTQCRATPPEIINGLCRLFMDTYNPTALKPGDSFYGSEIRTDMSYERGEGLIIEARTRLVSSIEDPIVAGMVASLFTFQIDDYEPILLYDVRLEDVPEAVGENGSVIVAKLNNNGDLSILIRFTSAGEDMKDYFYSEDPDHVRYNSSIDDLLAFISAKAGETWDLTLLDEDKAKVVSDARFFTSQSIFDVDEIDFELLSNDVVGRKSRVLTNLYDDSLGDSFFANVPGLDLTQFNLWRIEWLPDRIRWFVNGNLVRVAFNEVPDEPQRVHLNFWVPLGSFAEAYSSDLRPVDNQADNKQYQYEIDYVRVERVESVDNLLPAISLRDPGFESGELGLFWRFFGVADLLPSAHSGDRTLKMNQTFIGGNNASGVYQILPIIPGQEYGFSAWVRNGDELGNDTLESGNRAILKIEWLDGSKNMIEGAAIVDRVNAEINASTDPVDWNFLHLSGIAPSNAQYAQVFALHVYTGGGLETGASYFDDFSFQELVVPFKIVGLPRNGNKFEVTWGTHSCEVYTIQKSNDLKHWTTVKTGIVGAPFPAVTTSVLDTDLADPVFYRICK